MTLEQSLELLLRHEGGFVNHSKDPGGATRYGITETVARSHGYKGKMTELPLDLAKSIYKKDYWDRIRADDLPASIRFHVFDAAVNSGVSQAVKWLQEAAGVAIDGVVGPDTVKASQNVSAAKYSGIRLRFMTNLKTWEHFGKGWARRIADNLQLN